MKSKKFYALVLVVLLTVWVSSASAQSDRGSITGTVTDQTGAVVPNAKVTVTNLDSNETREATTSDEGSFSVPELKAAPYKLTVEATGFKTATIENIQVAVQVSRRADVALEVGVVTDVVTITSDTTALQIDSPVRQTNVTERQVKELPLLVTAESAGRTPLAFIFLDSNVTAGTGTGTNASNFRVSGGQSLGTEILIDGAATRRTQKGTFFTEVAPGPNAYQEFTLSTSSYSAEFGNSSGGIVNFTLKSGGNDFHGEVYDLFQNDALNANSFLNNAQGLRINRDHQHDFGGNIGGPIMLPRFGEGGPYYLSGKNRAFFFFNFEGYRFARGENVFVSVPTLRMRQGDFGELLTDPVLIARNGGPIQIYDSRMPVNNRNPIPNNDLRTYVSPVTGGSIIDPVGLAIAQFFPAPTSAGVFRNYLAQTEVPNTMNSPVFKLDFVFSDKQRLAFSYAFRDNTRVTGGAPRFPEPFVADGVWQQFFKSHFFRLQHDYTFSPRLLNHFNAGYNRYDVANKNFTEGFNELSLGFPAGSVQNKAFPKIAFPGYGDPADPFNPNVRAYQGIGSTFFSDRLRDNAMELTDFMTYVRGNHTMKFGADVRNSQFNVHQLLDPGGEINFRANQTANNCCEIAGQGFPIASLLTGATEFSFNSVQNLDPGWRQFSHSYFFQDDIRVTPRLTINAGIRYDLPGLRFESRDRFRGFDPDVANPAAGGRLGAIVGAGGQGGLQAANKTLANPDHSNIGPRLGFAYSLNDKTVLRGGAGLYYAPILYGFGGNNTLTEGTIGYNSPRPANINGGADANPDLFLRNYRQTPGTDPNGQFLHNEIDYFDKNFKTGRTFQYGLDIQRELPYNFVIQLSYTGHRADRLRSDLQRINAIPLNALRLGFELLNRPLSAVSANERAYAQSVGVTLPASNNAVYTGFTGSVGEALKPFPQYGNIRNQLESLGKSWYNAGTIKLDRRFARGIQFGLSYTFSKLITDASEDLFGGSPIGSVIQNPYDRNQLRSVSPNSIPHVFVVNYLIELPFGKGKRWMSGGGLSDRLFGGWQISGIQRYQSGLPLVIRRTGQDAFSCSGPTGFCTDIRPNLTGQDILTNDQTLTNGRARIFNAGAFSAPPSFNQGAPAELLAGGVINPAYVTYYSNPLRFFGDASPVIDQARDIPFLSENISLLKKTRLSETFTMELGAEFFNIFNRHRLTQPGSDINNAVAFGFSSIDAGYEPRIIQIRVRFTY
ncbi:MAG TPA: carboxypeptidase regulatory-like domain-containing protein [Pyrinomonadaceae bacterium]|nr:carboxypeptidase regulatory-like domain-containing protein [Pyrinomonadaceae bacterium]